LVAIEFFSLITTVPVCGEEKSWSRKNQKDYKMYGFSCYKRSYYMIHNVLLILIFFYTILLSILIQEHFYIRWVSFQRYHTTRQLLLLFKTKKTILQLYLDANMRLDEIMMAPTIVLHCRQLRSIFAIMLIVKIIL
jgi:hypothetical protein